jgi:hypothetical protein
MMQLYTIYFTPSLLFELSLEEYYTTSSDTSTRGDDILVQTDMFSYLLWNTVGCDLEQLVGLILQVCILPLQQFTSTA